MTKKDQAYRFIRQAIVAGDLRPGDILNIGDLSGKYQVGITPVREALIMLESEGFIQSLPRTGFVITTLSVQEVLETFHLRIILEVEAIGLAVTRITNDDLNLLEENQRQEIMLGVGGENHQRSHAYVLNREFHQVIARASGNRRLARLVEQFLDEMERILAVDPYIADPVQHAAILEALKRRDIAAAREAMRQHLDNTLSRIVERF